MDFTDIDITDSITVSAWIKPNSGLDTYYEGIVDKGYSNSWFFGTRGVGSHNLSVWMNNGERAYTADNAYSNDIWTFIVFTYDKDVGGTDEIKIYVNGSLSATGNYSTAMGTNNNPVRIGDNIVSGDDRSYFDGLIDEVKIWNYALTAEQVKTEYNGGAVRFGE